MSRKGVVLGLVLAAVLLFAFGGRIADALYQGLLALHGQH